MPELPDIELYLSALAPRIVGQRLDAIRLASPFLVRSIDPPADAFIGRPVRNLRRLGKRIVWVFDDELFAVFHLMIAGRFRWKERGAPIPAKVGLAAFDFASGTLLLTEAGAKRRASLYFVRGTDVLRSHDPGGLEVLPSSAAEFAAALRRENHTVKRALTDPHLLSGIGNAYSDEILHAAKMSPMKLTGNMTDAEMAHLHDVTLAVLTTWRDRLQQETGVPRRDGRARALRQAVPRVRDTGAADSLRGQRGQLLSDLPDRR
jgi:formamidopyrimidine-DNA glycosylase